MKRGLIPLLSLAVLALTFGSVQTSWQTVWQALLGNDHGLSSDLVLQLRLPRAINAFTTGALLALAGAR